MPKVVYSEKKGLRQESGGALLELDGQVSKDRYVVEAITAAKTLAQSDSGKVFTIDADGGAYAITLPTATSTTQATNLEGWSAMFVLTDIADTNVDITIVRGDTDNDALIGNIGAETAADGAAGTGLLIGSHVVTFAADGTDTIGDMVEIVCHSASSTATSFFARGYCAT